MIWESQYQWPYGFKTHFTVKEEGFRDNKWGWGNKQYLKVRRESDCLILTVLYLLSAEGKSSGNLGDLSVLF